MSKKDPARRRLTKADRPIIVKALEVRGYDVRSSEDRVEAWCNDTGRYICGFYWRKAEKAVDANPGDDEWPGHPARPAMQGGWRFDLAISDCFSLKDLKTAMNEAGRIRRLVRACRAGWESFTGNRSEKRWIEYRGHVAALFMRQDPKDDSCDGS